MEVGKVGMRFPTSLDGFIAGPEGDTITGEWVHPGGGEYRWSMTRSSNKED